MDKLFKAYADLDEKIKIFEEEKRIMREGILEMLRKEKLEKAESPHGRFTRAHKINWRYSPKITTAEEKLKIAKIREQEKGVARPEVSEYLLFTKPKEE